MKDKHDSSVETTRLDELDNNTDTKLIDSKRQTTPQHGAPPDGGWGWMVVFSSFSISLLVDGVCFSFGIFFDEFRSEFQTTKATTSWIGSVLNGSYLIFGPIVSALVNLYGCRRVAMSGAVLATCAFFASTYSTTIGLLIFSYGFLGGIGFGLMYLPAIVMVGYYFERRRALATGIACCGSGVGAFLFAPFSEHLLQEYGWRGATWILSALVLHGFMFSIFYRPISTPKTSGRNTSHNADTEQTPDLILDSKEGDLEKSKSTGQQSGEASPRLNGAAKKSLAPDSVGDTIFTENPKPASAISQDLRRKILDSLDKTDFPVRPLCYRTRSMTLNDAENVDKSTASQNRHVRMAHSQDFISTSSRKTDNDKEKDQYILPPLQRKDIFYSGSVQQLKEYKELGSLEEFRREVTSSRDITPTGIPVKKRGRVMEAFMNIFDMSLLKSPTFLIYGASCFLCMAGFFVPFIYMPTHVVDLGVNTQDAAFLISIIGITNTVGRVLTGFVSDQPWVDCLLINNVALIIGGTATIFVPFFTNYSVLALCSAIFGTSIAVFVSLRSIIMVELMGLEKLTTAFGFVIMCQGMSSLLGPPIAGALSDATGNYSASFYLAGISLTLSGVVCLPLRRIAHWESARAKKRQKDTENDTLRQRDGIFLETNTSEFEILTDDVYTLSERT